MVDNESITIERAVFDDLPSLLELYHYLHENDPVLNMTPEVRGIWDEILRDPHHLIFVARYEGRIVSSCTLIFVLNLTRGARPYGLIENVVTHVGFRNRGIGTRVVRHALQYAWEQGCYKVMLLTGRKDEETLRFYELAGFLRGVKTGFVAYPPVAPASEVSP